MIFFQVSEKCEVQSFKEGTVVWLNMAKPFTKPKLNEAIWATSQVVKPPQETTSKTGPASRNEVVRDIEAGDRGYTGMILGEKCLEI